MNISPSETIIETAGEIFNLSCSANISISPSQNVTFEWFFGPDNSTLPTGVIVSNVTNNSNTYTSTLQLSSLTQSHAGMYTCQIGGNERLAANATVSVNTQSLATSASDNVGNSDSHSVPSNPSSNFAVTVTIVVVILIIIAAIITVVVITAIVYR